MFLGQILKHLCFRFIHGLWRGLPSGLGGGVHRETRAEVLTPGLDSGAPQRPLGSGVSESCLRVSLSKIPTQPIWGAVQLAEAGQGVAHILDGF